MAQSSFFGNQQPIFTTNGTSNSSFFTNGNIYDAVNLTDFDDILAAANIVTTSYISIQEYANGAFLSSVSAANSATAAANSANQAGTDLEYVFANAQTVSAEAAEVAANTAAAAANAQSAYSNAQSAAANAAAAFANAVSASSSALSANISAANAAYWANIAQAVSNVHLANTTVAGIVGPLTGDSTQFLNGNGDFSTPPSVTSANTTMEGTVGPLSGNADTFLAGNGAFTAVAFAQIMGNATLSQITGLGNVASINTTGNTEQFLNGNGAFIEPAYPTFPTTFAYANITGTPTTYAVANITGIGNVATTNFNANGQQALLGNGAFGAISAASGADGELQYSNGDLGLSSSANLTFDGVATFSVPNVNAAAIYNSSGSLTLGAVAIANSTGFTVVEQRGQSISGSGNVSFDFANGNIIYLNLTGNAVFQSPTNFTTGFYTVVCYTNGHSITCNNSIWKFPGALQPVTGSSGWDVYSIVSIAGLCFTSQVPQFG